MVRWVIRTVQQILSCLGCSSQPSTKYFFPHRTLFPFISPHRPGTWAGSRAGSPLSVCLVVYIYLYWQLKLSGSCSSASPSQSSQYGLSETAGRVLSCSWALFLFICIVISVTIHTLFFLGMFSCWVLFLPASGQIKFFLLGRGMGCRTQLGLRFNSSAQ